jgi:pilus assembly protein Flp/PilA
MKSLIVRFVREEKGQDLIEYSLLGAIIALGAYAAMVAVKGEINTTFNTIDTKLGSANSAAQ